MLKVEWHRERINIPSLHDRLEPALFLYPLAHLAVEVYNGMLSGMWPFFMSRFGLAFGALGMLTMVVRGSMALPQIGFAALADRLGSRWIAGLNRSHLFLGMDYRMTELQGAVGMAQTAKLPAIVARRRETTGLLSKLIAEIPGVNPPYIIDDAKSAWWIYSFTIDQKALHVTPQEFAAAIKAEGLPFGVGYIPNPVFEYDVIRERKTFGTSGIPWTLPQARQGITYDRKNYPGTMRVMSETFVTNWNEGMTEADVRDIAKGLGKAATYFANKKG